ncbi:major facilitator superfamily MFS_1 [Desulfarculus baarsii DSM 2075]|uniref:Major facilitator superfamily MFS_1 n=1 Tax=Desulfarculus baarsii (strain ATCC 33931 / DSM 2075 / LMG 7858 / VKM B-1802 / 2st14) TaxID=644282 RepID=E1QF84_DESB2|nr:MFS transporter [Desulfarculus baarsii]ADK84220.1 major facilitator superfamily MFS_1 [Desulfarculus baarsii DSM 2075]
MQRTADDKLLLILGLAVFVAMLGVGSIVPFLSIYGQRLGASGALIGLIFSAFSFSRGLFAPLVGLVSDRVGRKLFIALGLAGNVGAAVALLFAQSAWDLLFCRMAQGVFAAMILPVCLALVADLTPAGQEGRYVGGFNTAFLLGFGLGPFLGGVVYDVWDMAGNLYLMGGFSLLALAAVWLGVREPRGGRGKIGGASHGMRLYADRAFVGLMLARVGMAAGMGCFIAFLPLLAVEKGLAQAQVGTLLGLNVIVMVAVQRPGGALADRWPRLPLALAGLVASGACKAALPLCDGFWQMAGAALLEGLGSGLGLPPLMALVIGRGKDLGVEMGATMGAFTLALSLGVFAGPPVGGWLADQAGQAGPLYFAGAVTIVGALAMAALTGSARVGLGRS